MTKKNKLKAETDTDDQVRTAARELGRLGGSRHTDAQVAARKRNGITVGSSINPPAPENVAACERIADAIPSAVDADRTFLIKAFTRLAPDGVYNARWQAVWGTKLESSVRRKQRGWGPKQRNKAVKISNLILSNGKVTQRIAT